MSQNLNSPFFYSENSSNLYTLLRMCGDLIFFLFDQKVQRCKLTLLRKIRFDRGIQYMMWYLRKVFKTYFGGDRGEIWCPIHRKPLVQKRWATRFPKTKVNWRKETPWGAGTCSTEGYDFWWLKKRLVDLLVSIKFVHAYNRGIGP